MSSVIFLIFQNLLDRRISPRCIGNRCSSCSGDMQEAALNLFGFECLGDVIVLCGHKWLQLLYVSWDLVEFRVVLVMNFF